MPHPDLELHLTSDLIEELMGRFDTAVFAGMSVTVENPDKTGENTVQHVWKGCCLTCAGIASELQFRILRDRAARDEE